MAKEKISTDSRKINSKPIFDVLMDIAQRHNIHIADEKDLPFAGLYFGHKGRDVIWLNSSLPIETKAEVLAHEIGHYKLHNFRKGDFEHAFSVSADSPKEIEANRFGKKLVGLISRNLRGVSHA